MLPTMEFNNPYWKCNLDSESSSSSDCESSVTRSPNSIKKRNHQLFSAVDNDKFSQVNEDEKVYNIIKRRFISGLGNLSKKSEVIAIHKKNWNSTSCILGPAKVHNFQIYSQAIAKKHGSSSSNVKYAWFGSSKEGVSRIMNYGFGIEDIRQNEDALFGKGVYLYPDHCSLDSAKSAVIDENGLKHVIICRVILGNQELIHPYSDQSTPSSENFDSGTDDIHSPKKYVIWSMNMNAHILPEYVVSFRAPLSDDEQDVPVLRPTEKKFPTSPWMPFTALIPVLAKFLPPRSINLIQKSCNDHKERKISRNELVQKIRRIAGDELLIATIKSYRANKC